jgi:excisionase family DNA binding protein
MPSRNMEFYLTVREVAKRFGVCTATVYALVKAGKLPHIRVSNSIRVPASALPWAMVLARAGTIRG